jgi:hypothetical protein
MVVLESLFELIPSDFVSSRLHRLEMFPPHQCITPKLQGRNVCLALLEQGRVKAKKIASTALTHASASSGSSALVNVGGFIPINWVYVVTVYGPS